MRICRLRVSFKFCMVPVRTEKSDFSFPPSVCKYSKQTQKLDTGMGRYDESVRLKAHLQYQPAS